MSELILQQAKETVSTLKIEVAKLNQLIQVAEESGLDVMLSTGKVDSKDGRSVNTVLKFYATLKI